jgi:AraC family transcriptional regulator
MFLLIFPVQRGFLMSFDPRIQNSVDYIDSHLGDEITLEAVAAASGFSLSHFYKIFLTETGFTIKEFIRNKRLARAARELVTSQRRILDIAVDAGFDSQEVFTRAFSSLYGTTPLQYRRSRRELLDFDAAREFSAWIETRGSASPVDFPIQARVEPHSRIVFIGMEMTTSITENIDSDSIPRFWQEQFAPRVHEIPGKVAPNQSIGFERTDPFTDGLYHLACFQVQPSAEIPAGMVRKELPEGLFAVFTPSRPLDAREYSALVQYAYGEWLPMSGCLLDGDYTFDRYTMRLDDRGIPQCVKLEVFIPIRKT